MKIIIKDGDIGIQVETEQNVDIKNLIDILVRRVAKLKNIRKQNES